MKLVVIGQLLQAAADFINIAIALMWFKGEGRRR